MDKIECAKLKRKIIERMNRIPQRLEREIMLDYARICRKSPSERDDFEKLFLRVVRLKTKNRRYKSKIDGSIIEQVND